MQLLAVALALLALVAAAAQGASPLRKQLYTHIEGNKNQNSCVRLINHNSVIGCSSPESGAVGVLYRVATPQDLATFKAAPADAYIALISQSMMADKSTITTLQGYDKYKGAFVYEDFGARSQPYSADDVQPNTNYGLEVAAEVDWNGAGGGYGVGGTEGIHWQNFNERPIYLLNEEDRNLIFSRYNGTNNFEATSDPEYPLWGAQLKNFMYGVRDADLCLRRQQCDPLSGQNIYGTTKLFAKGEEVVMAAAQLDSMSLFHDSAFGANADASGLVALLAAARLLSDENNGPRVRQLPRNIMFMMFTGEPFGYIGSSSLGYSMARNNPNFPSANQPLSFNEVKYYLELNQLLTGVNNDLHSYTLDTSSDAATIVSTLQASIANLSLSDVGLSDETGQTVPPASLRGLLHEMRNETMQNNFGGVVLTDHGPTSFANEFYNSHLDDKENIKASDSATVDRLCEMSTMVAQTLMSLAADVPVDSVNMMGTANCTYVRRLLECITVNQRCDLARELVGIIGPKDKPINRYIGVTRDETTLSLANGFFYSALADALAVERNISVSSCAPDNTAATYQTVRLRNGLCINTTTYVRYARSPAFPSYYSLANVGTAANNYRDGRDPRWSTWTESVWGVTSARIFQMESREAQLGTLLGGLAYFFLSFGAVFAAMRYTRQTE